MKVGVLVSLCLVGCFFKEVDSQYNEQRKGPRRLFGGYRITPRYCKATQKHSPSTGGPNICMFNHECRQKQGVVVGACMDGFLFGACCQLKKGSSVGEYLDQGFLSTTRPIDITSLGVSHIAQTLLNAGARPTDVEIHSASAATSTEATKTTVLNHVNSIINDYLISDRTPPAGVYSSNTPLLAISLSNAPLEYTTASDFSRPKPLKPNDSNYVRVPTITHDTSKNSTEFSTTEVVITSRKPPSTSYVFSSTIPPKRPMFSRKPTTKSTKKPSTFVSSSTKTTWAYSPSAFVTTAKPPSTSYVYSSSPTRRPPPSTLSSYLAGPSYSVSSNPISSTFSTPAPTIIVLGPLSTDADTEKPKPISYEHYPVTVQRPTALPNKKNPNPVNHVTINQHLVQNIYSTTSKPYVTGSLPERPSPTVLITPKPSISSPDYSDTIEVGTLPTSPDDSINFPPVRNPNLNMSHFPSLGENDITTPGFIEDESLNANVESFVNQVIQGLKEPFQGLRDVVSNRKNITQLPIGTTVKPTTRKPTKASTVSKKPVTTRPVGTNTRLTTTLRPVTTTKSPNRRTTVTVGTTKRPTNTKPTVNKKTKPTKKTATTVHNYIEHSTEYVAIDPEDYRTECGKRPLIRSAKIVGGKGAVFGEFPWQVLVRESTWLGLFTKNKCGGVLISHKYVMTAAHCQPGFLASLVAVFGEFDISGDLEKRRPLSRNVKRVIVHRQYDAQTFENDLAILELDQPVQFDQHIIPICLPRDEEDFTGRMATVTGWGRLKYGGGVPSVLQEVQVPIMENHVCQEMFRTAGHSKVILESFLCAGYANGQKDSCEGDSGGPLVLQRPDGRYQLAGTVSHGIKCAAPYLPGVYMRTQYFKPWITSVTGVAAP